MSTTTVPYHIHANKGRYSSVAFQWGFPVFTELPIEEDFNAAVKEVEWDGRDPRVLLDLGHYMIFLVKAQKYEKYVLIHEFSLEEKWTSFSIPPYGGMSYEEAMTKIKVILGAECTKLEASLRKMKRIIATPTSV